MLHAWIRFLRALPKKCLQGTSKNYFLLQMAARSNLLRCRIKSFLDVATACGIFCAPSCPWIFRSFSWPKPVFRGALQAIWIVAQSGRPKYKENGGNAYAPFRRAHQRKALPAHHLQCHLDLDLLAHGRALAPDAKGGPIEAPGQFYLGPFSLGLAIIHSTSDAFPL